METFLLEEGDKMDPATKRILQNLIDRKLKVNHYSRMHYIFITSAVILSALLIFLFFHMVSMPYRSSVFDIINYILKQNGVVFFAAMMFVLFGAVKITMDKKEKSEKEFHTLRCEVIEKSGDLWKGEQWENRHIIYEKMKSQYDINLYYLSK